MKGNNQSARLYFIDNLRVVLITLVVAHHGGQPYGPTGGQWALFNPERSAILGPFFGVNAAFFMGLFFLVSGLFVPGAFDRKGAGIFLKDRFFRLGIPLLIMGFFVHGPLRYNLEYISNGGQQSFWWYFIHVYVGQWQVEFAHMWFVFHLLVYAFGYVILRRFMPGIGPATRIETPLPGHPAILTYTLVLAAITWIVRIWYPIDLWARVFWVVPAEIAHLPQYLSLFVIGIVAYRYAWLQSMNTKTGITWLWIGLTAAGMYFVYSLAGWQLLPSIMTGGGFDWRSLVWSIWEAFICVGLCIGLLVLFRERYNKQGSLLRILSGDAYTVYIIHLMIIIPLQFGLVGIDLPPFVKFVLVTLVGVPLCFGISHLIKKLPFAGKIL